MAKKKLTDKDEILYLKNNLASAIREGKQLRKEFLKLEKVCAQAMSLLPERVRERLWRKYG